MIATRSHEKPQKANCAIPRTPYSCYSLPFAKRSQTRHARRVRQSLCRPFGALHRGRVWMVLVCLFPGACAPGYIPSPRRGDRGTPRAGPLGMRHQNGMRHRNAWPACGMAAETVTDPPAAGMAAGPGPACGNGLQYDSAVADGGQRPSGPANDAGGCSA